MESVGTRKLRTESRQASENKLEGITYGPKGDSLNEWQATIEGPKGSVYEGTIVDVLIEIPEKYPFEAPIMKSDVVHPNIYKGTGDEGLGLVCLSLLHNGKDSTGHEKLVERWSPGKGISSCVLAFQVLLAEPNLESPANPHASRQYRDNRDLLKRRVNDAYLRKSQAKALKECSEVDFGNSNKRQLALEKDAKEKRLKEATQQEKREMKEKEKEQFSLLLPDEPQTGGILLKFKTKAGTYQRRFEAQDLVITGFDFLKSCGVTAETISVVDIGDKRTIVSREKAELSTFENLGMISGSVDVKEIEEEDQ